MKSSIYFFNIKNNNKKKPKLSLRCHIQEVKTGGQSKKEKEEKKNVKGAQMPHI